MNSLTELKQVIDSLEFQIDDDTVNRLQEQLSDIGELYSSNAALVSVLKRMQSISRYLDSKKDKAHEDAVPILYAIAVELERLIQDSGLNEKQTDEILRECLQLYRSLKTKIVSSPLVTDMEIQELKAIILEVDWEISDAALATFDRVTSQLLIKMESQKILHAFLKIIHSMGQYIASRKARAHKDSIFFLHSVFENFERVVQTPDMPFQEKKQLIQRDITAFNEFKREISTLDSEIPAPAHTVENEDLQPALSHVKVAQSTTAQDVVPLQPLSEKEKSDIENPLDSDFIPPALAGKKRTEPEHRDVMDELFTMKESPADQLLDAIHLSAIQGPDQKTGMHEPTQEDLQKQGIKNFTPTRMDQEPIPEIGNRLDEFFDMDLPAATGITPVEPHEQDPAREAVNRLKTLVTTQDRIMESDTLAAMVKDLDLLKTLWQDNPDKAMLLDSLAWLAGLYAKQLENLSPPVLTGTAPMGNDTADSHTGQPDMESVPRPPKGVWGKFKALFFS